CFGHRQLGDDLSWSSITEGFDKACFIHVCRAQNRLNTRAAQNRCARRWLRSENNLHAGNSRSPLVPTPKKKRWCTDFAIVCTTAFTRRLSEFSEKRTFLNAAGLNCGWELRRCSRRRHRSRWACLETRARAAPRRDGVASCATTGCSPAAALA